MNSLFNADRSVNMKEFAYRLKYWIDYAKTGAPRDVERAISALSILHIVLERELENKEKETTK